MRKGSAAVFLFVIFALVVIVALTATYNLSNKANEKVVQGDDYVKVGNTQLALKKYDEALSIWPLLGYTRAYKQRVEYAKTVTDASLKKPSLVIFLKDSATDEEIDAFITQLKLVTGFDTMYFITKEEAYAKYQGQITDPVLKDLFKSVSSDELYMSIEIYLKEPSLSWKVKQLSENKPFVEYVLEIK